MPLGPEGPPPGGPPMGGPPPGGPPMGGPPPGGPPMGGPEGPPGGDPEMQIHEAVAIELLQLVPRIVDIVRGGPGSGDAADLGLGGPPPGGPPPGGPMV